ncbi:hypothetical protein [Janthinobacterium sp.]|uniref:hypothetical protein n=1 Tax=Janthinobacterium sp. TaxID=1871054 RepID=UPI0026198A67|nr:hypothetical protein [Janthinobacterium sp.]
MTRIEAPLVQLVAVLLRDLLEFHSALRGERLARLHDAQHIEALICLQDVLETIPVGSVFCWQRIRSADKA